MTTLHVTPTGAGSRDGSNWANASTLNNLDSMVAKAGAGGTVLLRADMGVYNVGGSINLYNGGEKGAPVTIKGVNKAGEPASIEIVGTRAENWKVGAASGNEVFKILRGADDLAFENINLTNVGTAFRVGADVSNIAISHVDAHNVRRFFEDYASGSERSATISGLTLRDIEIEGFSKQAIRLKYNTNNVVIEDVKADSMKQDGDEFAIGVHLEDTVNNVLMRRVEVSNTTDTTGGGYWNGDGFATEGGVHHVRFENTIARGATDGGYDLKSTDTVLVNAYAEDNKRNFRFWGEGVTMIDSISVDPHYRGGTGGQAHVWVGEGGKATIINSKLIDAGRNTTVLDLTEGGVDLILKGLSVVRAGEATLIGGDANVVGLNTLQQQVKAASGAYSSGSYSQPSIQLPETVVTGNTGNAGGGQPQPTPPADVTGNTTYEAPSLSVAAQTASALEGQSGSTQFSFVLTRSGDLSRSTKVQYAVEGAGANAADKADFGGALPAGTVEFGQGVSSKTVNVVVRGDSQVEANEGFAFKLGAVENGVVKQGSAEAAIVNDDVAPPPAPPPPPPPVVSAAVTDLSSSADQTVDASARSAVIRVDLDARSGRDTVTGFGVDDILVTTKKLFDSNNDGLIAFGKNKLLNVDGQGSLDTINLQGLSGLKLLGESGGGFVYAHLNSSQTLAGVSAAASSSGVVQQSAVEKYVYNLAGSAGSPDFHW